MKKLSKDVFVEGRIVGIAGLYAEGVILIAVDEFPDRVERVLPFFLQYLQQEV